MPANLNNLERASEIFEQALALPPKARPAYLSQACGENVAPCWRRTNGKVASWPAPTVDPNGCHGQSAAADGRVESGESQPARGKPPNGAPAVQPDPREVRLVRAAALEAAGAAVETGASDQHEVPGALIGPYKLLERIGEGGFGTVYLAEQKEPVRRKVAVKVIKLGMDTRQVIARFEAERQALAMMDHPHIAKVLDAGTTPSPSQGEGRGEGLSAGRPYFVMELVKGVPITQYCDEQRVPLRERLALFSDVCHAVQHAHQKGIIHRDLKPSNVLVSRHDDKPVVKVIDFGIVKATGGRLTEKTIHTEWRQLIGTPAYMSPEQAGCRTWTWIRAATSTRWACCGTSCSPARRRLIRKSY